MSHINLNESISETILELYNLHHYGSADLKEYEDLLRSVLKKISKLLDYQDKLFSKIDISTSRQADFKQLSLIGYVGSHRSNESRETKLLDFIESYHNSAEHNAAYNVLQHIVTVLGDINRRVPKGVSDSYSFSSIVVKFSELVEFFLKLHHQAEAELVDYISNCLRYELDYYSYLKNGLDFRIRGKEEDTDRVFSYLKKAIESSKTNSNGNGHDDEPVFSLERGRSLGSAMSQMPLNFESNNTVLTDLYHLFLQILGSKSASDDDCLGYSKVLVDVFKKYSKFSFLEINSFECKEWKFNFLYNFLIEDSKGSDSNILPSSFDSINKRVISEVAIFPEMIPEQNLNINEYQNRQRSESKRPHMPLKMVDQTANSKTDEDINTNELQSNLSSEDQMKLINNLHHIIPLLNEFDLNFDEKFPSVLKHYIHYIYNDFHEVSSRVDHDYMKKIISIVNSIVDFENEEETQQINIRDVVLEFSKVHQMLMFSYEDQGENTLLMRFALKNYQVNVNSRKKVIDKWNLKTLTIGQLDYNRRFHWNPMYRASIRRRYMKLWFNRKTIYSNLEAEASNYHSKVLKDYTLQSEWLTKYYKNRRLEKACINNYERKFLLIWHNKLTSYYHNINLCDAQILAKFTSKFFSSWIDKVNSITASKQLAEKALGETLQAKKEHLVSILFYNWYNRLNSVEVERSHNNNTNRDQDSAIEISLAGKIKQLSKIETKFTCLKHWNRWKRSYSYRTLIITVKAQSDRSLLHFTFDKKWHRKVELQNRLNNILTKRSVSYKAKVFEYWLDSRFAKENAYTFDRRRLLTSAFGIWRLRVRETPASTNPSFQVTLRDIELQQYLKIWMLRSKRQVFENRKSLEKLMSSFHNWLGRTRALDATSTLALDLRKSTNYRRYFLSWLSRNENVNEQVRSADFKFEKKYFEMIKNKFQLYCQPVINDEKKLNLLSSLEDKILKSAILKLWQLTYENRYQANSFSQVAYFKENVSLPLSKEKFFRQWVIKFNDRQMKLKSLSGRLEIFNSMLASKQFLFQKWFAMSKSCWELEEKADMFGTALLYKKFLLIWYDQFVNKSIYLNEVAEDFLDQNDVRRIRDIIGGWSMKYIKVIRSNAENCEFFKRKWEVAKLKSVLELWRYKAKEIYDDTPIDTGDYVDPDVSMYSNSSPLAKKSSKSFAREFSPDQRSSYLFTPLKQRVKGRTNLATPLDSRSSPTKLQETSQRMKSEKLDALRKHFGRAKGSSPPKGMSTPFTVSSIESDKLLSNTANRRVRSVSDYRSTSKVDINSSNFVKLSPPERGGVKVPRPPNFDLSKRNVTISTSVDRDTKQEDVNDSIIESAKSLRKITPIVFPWDEGLQEPRFSPVKTLKERMEKDLKNPTTTNVNDTDD